ncbi:MAG: HEAT repeat domain-containing protein, partial [Duncaniella sp.]|nr:HEAT repeat domain-containing protein [Duncaniella sp.]
CYNGDFREDDCIASRYIFADGNTVTTFANSVNVLQDKQANEMLGLLWAGARVGQWAQETNILESHILGDPTYRFTSSAADVDGAELCRAPYTDGAAELAMLESPYTDVRNLAMHRMWRHDAKGLSELYKKVFLNSPVSMERFTALSLLEKINDQNYRDVLPQALNDPNEFIRRTTVTRMGKVGLDEYVEPLVELYFDDTQAERVMFQIENNIRAFSEDALNKALARHEGTERAKKLRAAHGQQKSAIEGIMGTGPEANWRRAYTQALRNNNIHPGIDGFLALAEDESVDEGLRLTMIEALAWYDESYRRDDIRAVCDRLRKKGPSKAIRDQAERTYYRLNNPNPSNK